MTLERERCWASDGALGRRARWHAAGGLRRRANGLPKGGMAFICETQQKEWARLDALHGAKTGEKALGLAGLRGL